MTGYKSGGVKPWYGGITKLFTIKSVEQKRKEVLNDPDIEPLFNMFYMEGMRSAFNDPGALSYTDFLKDLKNRSL